MKWCSAPATTVTVGEKASEVSVALALERCRAIQAGEPGVVGALAPGPVPEREPYTIATVSPPFRFSPDTVIVRPATEAVPAEAVTAPGALETVEGVDQPVGTSSESEPFSIGPAAV